MLGGSSPHATHAFLSAICVHLSHRWLKTAPCYPCISFHPCPFVKFAYGHVRCATVVVKTCFSAVRRHWAIYLQLGDKRPTSNVQHRTSSIRVAFQFKVGCSKLDVGRSDRENKLPTSNAQHPTSNFQRVASELPCCSTLDVLA